MNLFLVLTFSFPNMSIKKRINNVVSWTVILLKKTIERSWYFWMTMVPCLVTGHNVFSEAEWHFLHIKYRWLKVCDWSHGKCVHVVLCTLINTWLQIKYMTYFILKTCVLHRVLHKNNWNICILCHLEFSFNLT